MSENYSVPPKLFLDLIRLAKMAKRGGQYAEEVIDAAEAIANPSGPGMDQIGRPIR